MVTTPRVVPAIQGLTKGPHREPFSPANGRLPEHPPRQSQPTGAIHSHAIVHYQPISRANTHKEAHREHFIISMLADKHTRPSTHTDFG